MSALENILGMLPDRVGEGKNSQIYTPPHIAEEMVNALPAEVFNKDTTFLDICCKSGIFLYKIYQKLMESPSMIADFPNETDRATHIVHKQLFGIAPSTFCKMFSTRTVYGYLEPDSHIISLGDNYNHVMQNPDRRFLLETLKKEFNMKAFDIVIGNPPYNKGMDLDFVDTAYKLSKNETGIVCMITPAKWQTAEADQRIASKISYGEFREKYVPHMSHVVFYPCCKDVFDILQVDGITWFLLDKNSTYDKCKVVNKSTHIERFNSTENRNITKRQSLINIGNEIIEYLGDYKKFDFGYTHNKRFQVWTNSQVPGGGLSTVEAPRQTQFVGISEILDTQLKKEPNSGTCTLSYEDDTEQGCKYFISWLNTKFTRFFIGVNQSKLTGIICNDCFRFVPAPPSGKFDHIYTDEELYKAFNLPQKYIDVIEAVIKERK